MSTPDNRPVTKVDILFSNLEMWEGRKEFAEQQIANIRQELGVLATRQGFVLLQGGQDSECDKEN